MLTALTNAFPLWLLLASGIALVRPELFTWFSGPFITVGLGVIMLSMGMTVGFEDFRRIARERTSVLPASRSQYTLMPLLGWSLGWLLDLPAPFAVGLILVSCCPAGPPRRHHVSGSRRRRALGDYDDRLHVAWRC